MKEKRFIKRIIAYFTKYKCTPWCDKYDSCNDACDHWILQYRCPYLIRQNRERLKNEV